MRNNESFRNLARERNYVLVQPRISCAPYSVFNLIFHTELINIATNKVRDLISILTATTKTRTKNTKTCLFLTREDFENLKRINTLIDETDFKESRDIMLPDKFFLFHTV